MILASGELAIKRIAIFLCGSLIASLIPVYALEDKKSTAIFITLEETKELIPDVLNLSLSAKVNTLKENDAVNILGMLDKSLRTLGFEYKGGRYSVYKKCWWEREKQVCHGYEGTINYYFKLKDPSEQNKIFGVMSEFKETYGERISFAISDVRWSVLEKTTQQIEEELQIKILDKAKNFAQRLSEKLMLKCYLTNINYITERPIILRKAEVYPTIDMKLMQAPEPKKEEEIISVKAQVSILCQ